MGHSGNFTVMSTDVFCFTVKVQQNFCLCNEDHFDIRALRCINEEPTPFKESRVARLSDYKIIFVASLRNFMYCSSTGFHQVWFRCKLKGASEASSRGKEICLSHHLRIFSIPKF